MPNGTISGLDSEQLEWVSNESSNRMVIELDPSVFEDVDDFLKEKDYTELDDAIATEMDKLEKESIPKGTQYNYRRSREKIEIISCREETICGH